MKIIAIASIKGGVGKSSLAINLTQHLAGAGKTLAIDTDPQNSLTDFFLRDSDMKQIVAKNIGRFFRGQINFQDAIFPIHDQYSCVPSSIDVATIGKELGSKPSAIFLLHDILQEFDFDFALIDTPPSIDYPLHSSIMAADLVLIPFSPNRWTMRGIEIMDNEITEIQRLKRSRPKVVLVPYMITKTENLYLDGIKNSSLNGITKTFIPRSAAIRRSIDTGKVLKEGSLMWNVFDIFTKEILEILKEI